ncbi:LOW QUALITY PROTEIN: uncharacterized protein LOC100908636 [Galendromus occidentalis]|uniref:LOW QUALITY PROTEIN: uncharacterized protein LOC100908636 n=1 Tax=Galendromus occidentalis TaxID=34638 RepID=A0AAJ6QRI4_9ACAR|nr:LOW QUALITY PROTEIN: uncharacterized protein LOC100908636 [Galendromus occidentalis]
MHCEDLKSTVSVVSTTDDERSIPAVLLHTASAFVVHGSQRIPVRLFLDSGSALTFVSPRLMHLLPDFKPISSARLGLTTFTSNHDLVSKQFRLTIQSTHDSARVDVNAYEYDFMVDPSPRCSEKDRKIIDGFAATHRLADSALATNTAGPSVSLLIGRDQFFKIAHVGIEQTLEGELVARGSILGWIIGGTAERAIEPRLELLQANVHCCVASISRNAEELERLWSLEAIGIEKEDASPLSSDELSATRQFKDSLKYENSRYTVSMPRRPGVEELRDNLEQALDRLNSKLRGLRSHPVTYSRYHQEVMSFVEQGHAEEVGKFSAEVYRQDSSLRQGSYFMPHHNVVTASDKGEKWRIVFDCSSSARGCRSLNSYLLPGPNLNPDIVGVLLNFRLHAVAVSADIARAYLCINVSESDRQLFRFLWQGPEDTQPRCYQMKKVTWGATPSGFLLAATLREHFLRVDPESTMRLGESFYHDDLLRSFPSVADARIFADTIQDNLRSAGMELAKWKTNSRPLAEHLTRRGVPEAALNLDAGKLLKVLGISWHPTEDSFQFALDHVVDRARATRIRTKRSVLRLVASIYDPLGWLAPFLIRGKLLLRALWAADLKWDDPLSGNLTSDAQTWTEEVPALSKVRIPRCIGVRGVPPTGRHLHLFGDASPIAYSAVAYMQTLFADGTCKTSIIMSKTRVAPRQPLSLPRLELMAALLTVRLRNYIVDQLMVPVDRVTFYTDSMVTYYWCTASSAGRWKTFVNNRVSEIQASSTADQWHHVPGSLNIADLATRGVSAGELSRNTTWWRGPEWLSLPETERPISQPGQDDTPSLSAVDNELRMTSAAITVRPDCQCLVDIKRYSTLGAVVRTTEMIFRSIRRMRKLPPITASCSRQQALNHLIKWTQRQHFPRELEAASADDFPARNSKVAGLKLFIDQDGLLRARTRLYASPHFTDDEKTPIVIPGESHLASLLIVDEHRVNAHLGVSTILAALRRRYWITRGRQRIKSILGKCVICRKQHGPTQKVIEAPLPESRLSPVVPFQTSGLDFCGPFLTRLGSDTQKNYIALFTCSTVRAVHLELVPSMTTAQTHLAIRRFLSLYPECSALVSDNARSFVKAAADIKRLFNSKRHPDIRELLSKHGLEWRFICPRAPWHGGFWERMVGTVKGALKRTLGRSLLTFEELRTIIAEIAATVNNRPLTYVSGDPDEPTPLTPSHFLRGAPLRPPLCSITPLDEMNKNRLRSDLLNRTTYYRALATRWRREYITQLRSISETERGGKPVISVGDVCLLEEDNRPRIGWQLVRVLEQNIGRDGVVRTYTVKFANGYVTRRAARLLVPLEVA